MLIKPPQYAAILDTKFVPKMYRSVEQVDGRLPQKFRSLQVEQTPGPMHKDRKEGRLGFGTPIEFVKAIALSIEWRGAGCT